MATVHVLDHPLLQHKLSILRDKNTGVKEIIINYVGPVIGAHTGPGVISVFFLGTER